MKHLKVATLFMAGAMLTSSCVGSFSLFNRLANWNRQATNEKFLNELIFIIIRPHTLSAVWPTHWCSTPSSSGRAATPWHSA